VITTTPVPRVLDVLREAGYAPAAEAADGEVVSLGVDLPRAPSRQPARAVRSRAIGSQSQLGELVSRIRSGDAITELAHTVPAIAQQIPGVTSAATMGVLREAIRDARRIVLGVAEPDGTATRHTILPISMGGGFVRGQESGSPGLRSFQLHRITAVHLLAADEDDEE
jgi:predicted DNA-binding transcriptional regulator YafY